MIELRVRWNQSEKKHKDLRLFDLLPSALQIRWNAPIKSTKWNDRLRSRSASYVLLAESLLCFSAPAKSNSQKARGGNDGLAQSDWFSNEKLPLRNIRWPTRFDVAWVKRQINLKKFNILYGRLFTRFPISTVSYFLHAYFLLLSYNWLTCGLKIAKKTGRHETLWIFFALTHENNIMHVE